MKSRSIACVGAAAPAVPVKVEAALGLPADGGTGKVAAAVPDAVGVLTGPSVAGVSAAGDVPMAPKGCGEVPTGSERKAGPDGALAIYPRSRSGSSGP